MREKLDWFCCQLNRCYLKEIREETVALASVIVAAFILTKEQDADKNVVKDLNADWDHCLCLVKAKRFLC